MIRGGNHGVEYTMMLPPLCAPSLFPGVEKASGAIYAIAFKEKTEAKIIEMRFYVLFIVQTVRYYKLKASCWSMCKNVIQYTKTTA